MPSSKISQILNSMREDGFHYKLLEEAYFIVEMTGPATVQLARSDFRKASLVGSLDWPTDLWLLIGWFSNRMGTTVDDGARKLNNWLDRWQSGKLGTARFPVTNWRSRPVAKLA